MNAISYDFSIEKILSQNDVSEYQACLGFIQDFEKGDLTDASMTIEDTLEQATEVIDRIKRLEKVFEFLGSIELGKNATSDQQIIDGFDTLEAKLHQLKTFGQTVQIVREQIIRMMSSRY